VSRRQSVMKRLGLRAVALLVFSGLIATAMTLYAFGLLFQVFRSGDQRSYDYVLRGVSLSVYALPLFFACAGLCKLGPRFIYRICVEIVLLFVSVVTFIFVRKGQSIGSLTFARGSVGGFIVSSYEAVFVCALFIVAFSLQLYLVADRRYYGEANVIVGGALAVMGVFLPRLLEGYEFLQSHCEFRGCDSRDRFMIDISEVSIALSISMATLFLAGVTLPAWGAWIDRIFSCGGGVVEGSESSLLPSSEYADASKLELLALPDVESGDQYGESELSVTSSSVVQKENAAMCSASLSSSSSHRKGILVILHVASAAVGGIVAATCLSVGRWRSRRR